MSSVPVELPDPQITDKEISSYLKKYRLKKTAINITSATNALRAQKQQDSLPLGRDVSSSATDAPREIIYGQVRTGGMFSFFDIRGDNQWFDVGVTVAGHEIESIEKLYLDDCEVVFQSGTSGWSSGLRKPDGTFIPTTSVFLDSSSKGTDAQNANFSLNFYNPSKWTAQCRQQGCAFAYIMLAWDAYIFGDGLPEISFLIKGKKVRDPRTGTTYYSTNAALCIADYLTDQRNGGKVALSRIDDDSLSDAADICDEDVDILGGGTEKRYTINGHFTTDENIGRILEQMVAATGGHLTYSNGKYKFWPATWREPVLDLTEDDLRSSIRMQSLTTLDDIFNGVRGTYVSAVKDFIETDYPAVTNSGYVAKDKRAIWEDIDFNFVVTPAACQRLAKIELERIRQGIQVEVEVSLKGAQLEVPDNITLTIPRYGWVAKPFEVMDWDFLTDLQADPPEISVGLTLRETASGVFAWNNGEETQGDIAPNTNLPSPFGVPTPSGVTVVSGTSELYKRGDGSIMVRAKVSWSAFTDFFILSGGRVEIQYKKSSEGTWYDVADVPSTSTFTYATDIQDGINYDFRVRAVNSFGNAGAYVEVLNQFILGKTAKPSDVTGFSGALNSYGIQLAWNPITDLDLKYYQIIEGATEAGGTVVFQNLATRVSLNTRSAGTHKFWIRAVDTSLNLSNSAALVTIVVTAQSVTTAVAAFDGPDLVLDWDEAVGGTWAVDSYNVYYGSSFGSATFVVNTKSTIFRLRPDWSGARKFWIEARDVEGNVGTPYAVDVNVVSPGVPPNLTSRPIDNNVFLSWAIPNSGSLPVSYYNVYRSNAGETFDDSDLLGNSYSTFQNYSEILAGSYIYWLTAVDTAGNEGSPAFTATIVDQPPDFTLHSNEALDLPNADTLTNVSVEEDGTLLLPVDTVISWEDSFSDNSWTTIQDKIDDGYTLLVQPAPSTAVYEQILDIGTLLSAGAAVNVSVTLEELAAGAALSPTISVSADGITWTPFVGVYSIYTANFQYVKVRLDATSDGIGVIRIQEVRVTASVKLKRDSGKIACLASDANGTKVTFNRAFYDVSGSPQVTPSDLLYAVQVLGNVGTTDYLSVADTTDFEPGTGDFTVAGWWQALGNLNTTQNIIGKWQTSGQFEWLLQYDASSKLLVFYVSSNGTSATGTITAANFGPIFAGQWLHIGVWHDSVNDKIGIKINKFAKDDTSYSSNVFTGTSRLQLGNLATGNPSFGLLKNWGIWKGRVLTPAELDTLCDQGFQKFADMSSSLKTNIKSFWELNESFGTRIDANGLHNLVQTGTVVAKQLPVQGFADFKDFPNPTEFYAYLFTESQVRVSGSAGWYADGYAASEALPDVGTPANLFMHFRADRIYNVADGGLVSLLEDQSSNKYHLTQYTPANQPTYIRSRFNGLPCLRFDGSNGRLTRSSIAMPAALTAFIVMAKNWTTAEYGGIMGGANYAAGAGFGVLTSGAAASDWPNKGIIAAGNGYNSGVAPRAIGPYGSIADDSVRLITVQLSSSSNLVRLDGTAITTVSAGGAGVSTTSSTFYLGDTGLSGGGSDALEGDIGEILIISSALTTGDIQAIEASLADKWGIILP